jgi:hypothetical protein
MSSLVYHPLLTEDVDYVFMGSGLLRLCCFCHQYYLCSSWIGNVLFQNIWTSNYCFAFAYFSFLKKRNWICWRLLLQVRHMLRHKIHVCFFHLWFSCSRLVQMGIKLFPLITSSLCLMLFDYFSTLLSIVFNLCLRNTCLAKRWKLSTIIMLSPCCTLFTIWPTRLDNWNIGYLLWNTSVTHALPF